MTVNNYAQVQGNNYNNPYYNPYSPAQAKFDSMVYDMNIFNNQADSVSLYNSTGYFVPMTSPQQSSDTANFVDPNQVPQPEENGEGGFWDGLGQVAVTPLRTSWEILKSGGKYVKNTISSAYKGTLGALGTLLKGHPIDAVGEVLEGAWGVVKAPFELVGDVASDVWNGVKSTFGGLKKMWDSIF